jgi:hypothetical protein
MMTSTATSTRTTTTTEARVRAVMQKVAANLSAFVVAGIVDRARAQKWADDITYLLVEDSIDFFELQLNGRALGLRYTVSSDGSIHQDSASGGLDIYGLPAGTTVKLYAHVRSGISQAVWAELKRRGWGFDGQKMEAEESEPRPFSSEGFGLTRTKLGTWP